MELKIWFPQSIKIDLRNKPVMCYKTSFDQSSFVWSTNYQMTHCKTQKDYKR